MSGEAAVAEAGTRPEAERTAMVLTASSWSANVVVGRTGREEGESFLVLGQLAWRGADGTRRAVPARAAILRKDAKLRLDFTLSSRDAAMTIPLEEFALKRVEDNLKEYVAGYRMVLRIGFAAADMEGTQNLDRVTFTFSDERPAAEKPALRPAIEPA